MIFATVGITLLIQTMSSSAITVAFPDITSYFNVSIVTAAWVVTVFQLAMVVTVPLAGKASDTLGRRRIFMFFVLLFTVGSILCAVAPSIYSLILFRVAQGVGAGGFVTSAAGIVADTFPGSRQRSIGFISTILTAGAVLGPNVGGWLTQYYGWRYLFIFAIPWGIAALIAGAILLKPDEATGKAELDIKGAGLGAAALSALIVGLTTLSNSKTSWTWALGLLVMGSVLLLAFLRHERASKRPMIDMEVLRGRPFVAANVFNLAFGFVMGVLTFVPLYAVTVYGASTLQSGVYMTPRTICMFSASIFSSFILVRWGYRKPILIGTLVMILAVSALGLQSKGIAIFGVAFSGITVMLVLLALSGIGHGFAVPAANNACIELMPNRVSTITGMRQTFRNLGMALGVAIGSIGLDSFGSLSRGFQVVLFGTTVLYLLSIPSIFAMPRSPREPSRDKNAVPRAVT